MNYKIISVTPIVKVREVKGTTCFMASVSANPLIQPYGSDTEYELTDFSNLILKRDIFFGEALLNSSIDLHKVIQEKLLGQVIQGEVVKERDKDKVKVT